MELKRCTHCYVDKPLDDFYRYRNGKPKSWCKRCVKDVNWEIRKRKLKTDPAYKERYYAVNNRTRRVRDRKRYREDPEFRARQLEAERKSYRTRKERGAVWKRDLPK